jgi:hypothetical protein
MTFWFIMSLWCTEFRCSSTANEKNSTISDVDAADGSHTFSSMASPSSASSAMVTSSQPLWVWRHNSSLCCHCCGSSSSSDRPAVAMPATLWDQLSRDDVAIRSTCVFRAFAELVPLAVLARWCSWTSNENSVRFNVADS